MTRQEFIDDVTSWSELIDFCYDQDCDICEDIYSEEAKDDHFNNDLVEMARNANDWEELLETLNDIPTGYDYYICNEYDEFRGADEDDFDSYKDDVLEWMDDGEYWDEYDEEEEPEEYIDPEDEVPVEKEDVSFAELFTTCSSQVQKLESDKIENAAAAEQEEATAFDELCVSVGITVTAEGSN